MSEQSDADHLYGFGAGEIGAMIFIQQFVSNFTVISGLYENKDYSETDRVKLNDLSMEFEMNAKKMIAKSG
ncbi:hypothetical protein H5410_006731 [Solanum commersonii]|uniref:Uncharacterized protein n=1 Tax=Solanum commersonii TaxID=4109 RepID=A0A9J6AAL2_SOLCO|nr:hypothetical protein H5410_006731 [Solanum commersonii]